MMVMKFMNFDPSILPWYSGHSVTFSPFDFFFFRFFSFLRLNGIFLEENRFMVVCVEEAFMDVLKMESFPNQ